MAYGDVAECYGNAVFSTNGPSRSALVPYARIPGNRVKQPKPRSPESAMLGHEFPPDGFDLLFELPPRSFDFAFELAPHCAPRRSVRNATINETINGVFWTVRLQSNGNCRRGAPIRRCTRETQLSDSRHDRHDGSDALGLSALGTAYTAHPEL
jgi:hypothetical protein